jgi:hypothetical protein
MVSLQINTQQIHEVISWNDLTVAGILTAFILAFGYVIYYLFKINQVLYKEHLAEIRTFNEMLLKINNQYSESINNLVTLHKK